MLSETIVLAISRTPDLGDIVQGTGGARKVRLAGRGKGKSGGYRVVTCYAGADIAVFLLAVRLGKLCGNGPDLWLNLQKRYDHKLAERQLGAGIKGYNNVGGL